MTLKEYLYILRLVATLLPNGEVRAAIDALIEARRAMPEFGEGPAVSVPEVLIAARLDYSDGNPSRCRAKPSRCSAR